MPRVFTKISPRLWQSKRVWSLPTDRDRLYYFYCLTSRHQCSAGLYRLPDEYVVADLIWSIEEVANSRNTLINAGLIHYDTDTKELFIDQWFIYNPPTNDRHAKGIKSAIADVESDSLRETAEVAFDQVDKLRKPDNKKAEVAKLIGGATSLTNTDYMKRDKNRLK